MKKLFNVAIFFLILPITVQTQQQEATSLIQNEYHITTKHFTNYVYRRFYFINRLHKTMTLFFTLDKNLHPKNRSLNYEILFNFDLLPFQHNKIKNSILDMQKKRSLKPLFMIWTDFVNYQSIDDQLLVEEFTKEILVVSRNLIISSQTIPNQEKKTYFSEFFKTIALPPCALLDIIDNYVSLFLHYNPSLAQLVQWIPHFIDEKKYTRIIDLKPFVHVDEVIERFYHIQRLNKPLVMLEKANTFPIYIRMNYITKSPFLEIHNIASFSHPNIISCMKVMNQTKTLEPLIELWQDIEQYKHIHDTLLMREFLILVYAMYIDLHSQLCAHQKNNRAIILLETIESLPLEEILQAIDILSKELPSLLDKYELKSDMSWKEWFKKYWWAPPLVTIAIGCKILIAMKLSKIFIPKTS